MTKRISDVAPAGGGLDGEQVKVRDLIGTEFTIIRAERRHGDNGEYWSVAVEIDGDPYFFFSSHKVVSSQLEQAKGSFPLAATVEERSGSQPGRDYFVLT